MPRPLRVAAAVVAALVLVVAGTYLLRNPERRTLDDAARRAAPGRFARLADGVTHYRLDGPADGSPVVLVHGFSVPSYIWDSTATALAAAGFRVLRYDQFGRGWSDRPGSVYLTQIGMSGRFRHVKRRPSPSQPQGCHRKVRSR